MRVITLLSLLLILSGCRTKDEITHFSGRQMTMSWEVKIAQKLNKKERLLVEKTILANFEKINRVYNNWNPDSEISYINHIYAHEKVTLSDELAAFLQHVGDLVQFTEGRFDPTVEPLQKLYKRSFAEGHWPEEDMLEEVREAIGWNKVHIEGTQFWKEHDKTALDLSGVAKGYAVDLITESLQAFGYQGVYVEWGGEIRTAGLHATGAPWRIAILGADVIEMEDEAIATSGNYYQRWEIEGNKYTHIIDPYTQKPLLIAEETIPSAAVKCTSCADADAIATSLMLFDSPREARLWMQEKKIFGWIIE